MKYPIIDKMLVSGSFILPDKLILVAIVFSLYFLFSFLEIHPKNIESETFATYISPLPALFGGFMGSFFQKTFNS